MAIETVKTTLAGMPALRTTGVSGRPTLMFLHGAFVTHEPWRPWMERLAARGWPSVAVARRGRLGVGPERARGLRVADYLADTLAAIDALGEAPILVGHSLGGLLAQQAAAAGRARALVLIAPAPAAKLTAQPVALPAYLPMFPRILAGAPVLPGCGGCARIALNRMPESERAALHATLVPESGAVYREMIFGAIKVDATKVRCPTYVIGGVDDRIVSPALMRFTAERYGAELKLHDAHAHWILAEPGWEAVADDVAEWLERVHTQGVSISPRPSTNGPAARV
jgi:pimeloyl-ACP methyl ester carboxylesterase